MTTRSDVGAGGGLPRGLLILLGTAAAFLTIVGMRAMADILGPILLALMLTIAVHPLRTWVRHRGFPAWMGTALGMIAVYLIMIVLALSFVLAGARLATLLTDFGPEFEDFIANLGVTLHNAGVGQEQTEQMLGHLDAGKLVGIATGLIGGISGLLSSLFFLLALLFFMSLDAGGFPDKLTRTPAERNPVVRALVSFAHGTRQYLLVSTVFGMIVALLDVVALYALGIPDPWLWGLLAFITNYIPNIGFLIGMVPPAILALLEHGVGRMVVLIAIYCILNLIIQSVIQPKVVGNTVGLSGTLSFLSLILWAAVLGGLGALLAIPLSLLVKALLVDVDPRAAWIGPLLSSGGGADPEPKESRALTEDPSGGASAPAES